MSVFTPTHASLDTIFGAQTSYAIPAYQRPYSWQALGKSDKTNQVNQMWDDLWRFFNDTEVEKEYFLGSIVIIKRGLRTYEVIDGQQRLTTLTLLFAAMKCFLERHASDGADDIKESDGGDDIKEFCARAATTIEGMLFNTSGRQLLREQKLKIERGPERYNFNSVLGHAIQCKTAAQSDIPDHPQDREIAQRYFENRDYFIEQLGMRFLTGGRFTAQDADRFEGYFTFLNTRVSLVQIETTDFDTAYSIFEILNNRGLPLNNRDLLRNFLIQRMADEGIDDPPGKWLALEREYALQEDFIGRFVESRRGEKLRASAFNELRKFYDEDAVFKRTATRKQVEILYDALRDDAERYGLIVDAEERVTDIGIRNQIQFIRGCGNDRYSINLSLAVFRHFSYTGGASTEVADFLRTYQRWLLYILLAPRARFSSEPVYRATRELREGRANRAQDLISLTDSQRNELSKWIGEEVQDADVGRLLVAAVIWQEEIDHPADVVAQRLVFATSTLEHILPQEPAAGSNWLRDFPVEFRKEYTHRLGNFTLLTGRTNSAARNSDFARKRTYYHNAKLKMTVELGALPAISPDFIRSRHALMTATVRRFLGLV